MSTKSIFKNVNLNSKKKVLRFLKALEETEKFEKNEQEVRIGDSNEK